MCPAATIGRTHLRLQSRRSNRQLARDATLGYQPRSIGNDADCLKSRKSHENSISGRDAVHREKDVSVGHRARRVLALIFWDRAAPANRTLLHIIAGGGPSNERLVPCAGGETFPGLNESDLQMAEIKTFGFVSRPFNLLTVSTRLKKSNCVAAKTKTQPKGTQDAQVETALFAVGMSDRAKHWPRPLSGGQEPACCGHARSLVTDPALIVADDYPIRLYLFARQNDLL